MPASKKTRSALPVMPDLALDVDGNDEGEVTRPSLVVSRPAAGHGAVAHPAPADALRLCVIDMGSNSFHALIVDAFPDATFIERARRKEMVKLGAQGFNKHVLTEAAMDRGVAALERIKTLAEGWAVSAYLACATSAVREARNGGAFIERVRQETGIEVRTITGDTEARLIALAVRHAVDLTEPSLLVDVGGGSTEFTVADATGDHYRVSLPLGAQRLTERFITTDPVGREEFRALREHVRDALKTVLAESKARGVKRVVGSSGSLNSLAQVIRASYGEAGRSAFEQTFAGYQVREVLKRVMRTSRAERIATPGIRTARASQIVAAAVLLDVVMKDLGAQRFVASPDALREGIVLDYVARERKWIRRLAPFQNGRREAVYELGMRLRFEREHAERVARFALQLFDATGILHQRGDDARELLEYAALLHDVGYVVSRHDHHKHSAYLIEGAGLRGFSPEEVAVIATAARYHRFGTPKATHATFQRMTPEQQRLSLELAALLRLANGLDRAHLGTVDRLEVQLGGRALRLLLHAHADPETAVDPALEVWAAGLGSDLFEALFGRPVEIAVVEPAGAALEEVASAEA